MTLAINNEPTALIADHTNSDGFLTAPDLAHDQLQQDTGEACHGGINAEELSRYGISIEQATDFSSNILARGPSPKVAAAVREANLQSYPDRDCVELRKAIAKHFHIDTSRILVGNGSCELIHLIARTVIQPRDSVLIVGPTFSEYARASQLASARVVECPAHASDDFSIPVNQIGSRLKHIAFRVVWLCNPNNPSGSSVCHQQILNWVRANPDTTFVIDESYIEFAEQAKSLVAYCEPNLVVLRSMTKSYGIAGLRLGFAVAARELYSQLCRHRVPWSVSAPAQAAGIAALQDVDYYSSAIAETLAAKCELLSELTLRGFVPIATDANYFLLPIDNAHQVRSALLANGIVVRDCSSFGLPNFLRIAILDPSNNRRLVDGLSRLVGTKSSKLTGRGADNASETFLLADSPSATESAENAPVIKLTEQTVAPATARLGSNSR